MQKLRFCVFGGLLSSCSASPSLLHSPCCCLRMPCRKHWGLSPGGGKQRRQERKTSAANLRKKHYYMPCKKRFFRLSSSYLYFFHILTIMCCQNKIFPRLRPFPVEHTGGVSSCSTGKRKPADHGRRVSSLPAKYSWISRKRDGEENVGQRGAPHTVIPVHTSVKDSESSVLPVCTFENTRRPSAVVPPGHKSHSFAQVRLIVNILSTKCCIS